VAKELELIDVDRLTPLDASAKLKELQERLRGA